MSGTETMQEMFALAASLLRGQQADVTGDHEAMQLLRALEYAIPDSAPRSGRIDTEMVNRAHLLDAAARFANVFELAAPTAPGLVSFGAQFDPVLADPLHAGSPLVGVSGVGLSLQKAFQSCVGEGVEYLSQLQNENDVLLDEGIENGANAHGTAAGEFFAALSERRTLHDRPLTWYRAKLTDGSEALLPADVCVRRPLMRRDFPPPFPLSIGSAAGPTREAAALHALLELVERDAASLWWRGGQFGRSIPPQHEASAAAEKLLRDLRQGAASRRRTWILDITTDIGVPCVVAVSCRPDGSEFAFGLAARPSLEAAVCSAIVEMCQLELADAVVATKRTERGDAALNAQDRTHLRRAAINADQCALLQPVGRSVTHTLIHATKEGSAFEIIVERLQKLGIETFAIDLIRPRFSVPVVRVVAPGLQLEPSEIITSRLRDTIARTGGGISYTGGVALI